jgi:hypothetical protein
MEKGAIWDRVWQWLGRLQYKRLPQQKYSYLINLKMHCFIESEKAECWSILSAGWFCLGAFWGFAPLVSLLWVKSLGWILPWLVNNKQAGNRYIPDSVRVQFTQTVHVFGADSLRQPVLCVSVCVVLFLLYCRCKEDTRRKKLSSSITFYTWQDTVYVNAVDVSVVWVLYVVCYCMMYKCCMLLYECCIMYAWVLYVVVCCCMWKRMHPLVKFLFLKKNQYSKIQATVVPFKKYIYLSVLLIQWVPSKS